MRLRTLVLLALCGCPVRVELSDGSVPQEDSGSSFDVGNSNHDDEVRAAIRELNTVWLTPARGYSARAPLEVEWIVLTHFRADHVGAFEALFSGADPIVLTGGVVHRGFVDVGAGRLYVTKRALAGGQGPGLVDVNGRVVVQTVEQGGGYWIQDAAAASVRR